MPKTLSVLPVKLLKPDCILANSALASFILLRIHAPILCEVLSKNVDIMSNSEFSVSLSASFWNRFVNQLNAPKCLHILVS